MLVRGAVEAPGQRRALARTSLARGRVAAERRAVARDALLRGPVDQRRGERHVVLNHLVHAQLAREREQHTHVVKQRARGVREVVTVVRESLDRGLAGLKQALAAADRRAVAVGRDLPAELAVHRAADLVHDRLLPAASRPPPWAQAILPVPYEGSTG